MDDLFYCLALNRIPNVGPRTAYRLQQRWPNLAELFQCSVQELERQGLPLPLVHSITQFNFKVIQEDLEWLNASSSHHVLTLSHPVYPSLLKEIADPPIVLYAKGQLSALTPAKLAMVGSRNPSFSGKENAHHFAKELSTCGLAIISGMALGIDAAAHEGTLAANGQTIGVLGTGIDCIYPQRHQQLALEITKKGLLLSEFPLKSPPIARHFPRRNRIISGLSLCTLVVEAAIKSGSLITAQMALEQNREVLAIPGSIHNPVARGCNYLIQQGAKLVTSVPDVLDELNLQPVQSSRPLISHKGHSHCFSQFIDFEVTTIDQILKRCGYTIQQVTAELAQLELLGLILSVPGGYIRSHYER